MGRKALTIGFVKEQFYIEKYIILSITFLDGTVRNSKQKLEYVCPKGHYGSMTWSNWQKGRRCPQCSLEGRKQKIEFIINDFEENGYKCLSKEYIDAHSKLDYICPNGHRHSITWGHWQQGKRCPTCAISKAATNRKKCFDVIRQQIEKDNYILVTEEDGYITAKTKLHLICPKGHDYFVPWDGWQQGHRCPKCTNNGVSKWEKVIKKYVSSLKIDYISNYRNKNFLCSPDTGRPLELDLWFPQLNKAIECNGIYWHSFKRKRFLDGVKQQFCNKSNIGLLIITDQEWNDDIKFCKSKIQNFLSAQ